MEGLRGRVGLKLDEAASALAKVSSAVRRNLATESSMHFLSQRAQLALIVRTETLETSLIEAREKLRREDFLGALAQAHLIRTSSEGLYDWILRDGMTHPGETTIPAVASGNEADGPAWKQSV